MSGKDLKIVRELFDRAKENFERDGEEEIVFAAGVVQYGVLALVWFWMVRSSTREQPPGERWLKVSVIWLCLTSSSRICAQSRHGKVYGTVMFDRPFFWEVGGDQRPSLAATARGRTTYAGYAWRFCSDIV